MTTKKQLTKQQLKKQRIVARERFKKARIAEKAYARRLKEVARQVGMIVKGFVEKGKAISVAQLNAALSKYSEALRPWAQTVAQRLIADIAQRDSRAWGELAREMGGTLKRELKNSPIGKTVRQLMDEQVDLITSLPLHAAQRVQKLALENMATGARAKAIQKEILRTGKVTESKAMTIARTETTRAVTAMVESRAQFVGSEGYIWRTAGDGDVRPLHRKLNGKFIKWSEPPVAGESGERAHAGAIYNCRCWPEPVLPDIIE
jgi:SPP1 gp7 family putative phage head morphogenesis protein